MIDLLLMGAAGEEVANPEIDWFLGLGVVLFLAGAGATWASLHLRGQTYERLNSAIDITFVRLTDRAIEELRRLRDHIDDVLPDRSDGQEDDDDDPFDPSSLVVDPASVAKPAKQSIRVLRERHVIHRQFDTLLIACTLIKVAAVLFTALVAVSALLYYFHFSQKEVWSLSCGITGFVLAVALILVAVYAVLDSRIQRSIEDSQRNERPAGVSR